MSEFIVFEGLDGTGKTTQIKLLAEYLASKGKSVFTTAEPTDGPTGKLLREMLGGRIESDPWSSAALFFSDRIRHCVGSGGIKENLAAGRTVISDRYYFSTFAYQGIDADLDAVMSMHYSCPELVRPDLVIFLTMSPEDCIKRITANRGAEEIEIFENVAALTRVSERFDTVFNMLRGRENVVRVDAGGTIEEVAARIREAVDVNLFSPRRELLLFDMDGTVFDNSVGIKNCIRYSLSKMGKPCPDEDTLRKFIGPSLFESYMKYIEADEENAKTFVEGYRERYAPIGTTEVCLYPRMAETLEALAESGRTLAIVSGKPEPFVKKIVAELGVDKYFAGCYCKTLSSHTSEKVDFVRAALADFAVPAENAVMIGDTLLDVQAGHGAGVDAIGVTYGFGGADDFVDEPPEATADSPEDIYRIVTGGAL